MLESDFEEGKKETINYPGDVTSAVDLSNTEWSDSDDESVDTPSTRPQQQIHTVSISSHSFSTYKAVLTWIITKKIVFAPLRLVKADASANDGTSSPAKRRKVSRTSPSDNTQPPVSAKSVYRLAHLLDLRDLQAEAIKDFKSKLTVDNVADQLFSSTSASYDEVRAAAAGVTAANWDQVGETEAMKKKVAEIEADEVGRGTPIMLAVAQAFAALEKTARA